MTPSVSVIDELAARREQFLAFVARRAGTSVDPQDVLQQAMLRATERLGQLRDRDRALAWFYAILRRAVSDARQSVPPQGDGIDPDELTTLPQSLNCDCSLRELERLAPQYADILRRIDVRGESAAAVAEELALTRDNVQVRLHRARQALRARLQARCGTTSVSACQNCSC
ncbi:MAG: sigma factor-like helix-turn-helix DNA-binding protein [Polyangiaceae bacterium]